MFSLIPRYGQFLVSTLPAYNVSEKSIILDENEDTLEGMSRRPASYSENIGKTQGPFI